MSHRTIIRRATLINEGERFEGDIKIEGDTIASISKNELKAVAGDEVIDGEGKCLLPGAIDDQVHFREPGLTYKEDLFHGSRAAVAGGVTSFMEMPNTIPQALNQELLEDKYQMAARSSLANYSFFMGASNDNLEEVLKTDPESVCGVKIFMGSSTGNMLVDNEQTLENLFSRCEMLMATHCEDEATVQKNLDAYKAKFGGAVPVVHHPDIRSAEACYLSSSFAAGLARKHKARLHILHISTAGEIELFRNDVPLEEKHVTAEACIHHLWFTDADYPEKGAFIKWNPAVKSKADREAIREAVNSGKIDVVATDHAPHTLEEKDKDHIGAPSGGPLVQHGLVAMMELAKQGVFQPEMVVEKMAHAPARLFRIPDRGYLREGYKADLVLLDPDKPWTVDQSNILYKCGWSPFQGEAFHTKVSHTFVNGKLVYRNDGSAPLMIREDQRGERLKFSPS